MDRSTAQKISLGFGIVYLLVAILGFIPGITQNAMVTNDTYGLSQGLLLGLFGVNIIHNLAHILFGVVLIVAGLNSAYTGLINRTLAVIFAITIIGMFIGPVMNGLALNWADTLLHVGSFLITAYLGFVATRDTATYTRTPSTM